MREIEVLALHRLVELQSVAGLDARLADHKEDEAAPLAGPLPGDDVQVAPRSLVQNVVSKQYQVMKISKFIYT